MITIQGKGVSTGVAAGPLYFYQRAKSTITRYQITDLEAEGPASRPPRPSPSSSSASWPRRRVKRPATRPLSSSRPTR